VKSIEKRNSFFIFKSSIEIKLRKYFQKCLSILQKTLEKPIQNQKLKFDGDKLNQKE